MHGAPRIRRPLSAAVAALALVAGALAGVLATTTPPAAALALGPALANGLARTPPMGWNDWNAFGCGVSESLVEQTAKKIVTSGLKAAGYQYVNIDDCWLEKTRDAKGNLVPDPVKFPDGIKGVAGYVHSLGLKLGIYESAGVATCAGYPGSLGHEKQDAATFASWGVDYLKYDNCNNLGVPWQPRYDAMRDALAATGRPIVYSLCEWGEDNVWTWGSGTGNLWRTTGDISDSFASMLSNFHQTLPLAPYAGPGGWNDPDMLEVGNGGMTANEDQAEFSLWAELAAPLISGTDLTKATPATLAIYRDKGVIAVDQDPLGKQGVEVTGAGGLDVLAKPLAGGDVAVVLFNENATAATITTSAAAVGLAKSPAYLLSNLWTKSRTETAGTISASVPGHSVVMYRVSPTRNAGSVPPDGALGVTGLPADWSAAPGPSTATETYTNDGVTPALLVRLGLTTPKGWRSRPVGGAGFPVVAPGRTVRATFRLTAPKPSVPIATSNFTATGVWSWRGKRATVATGETVHVTTPVGAPYRTFTSTTGYFGQWGGRLAIAGAGADTYGSTDEYSTVYRPAAMGPSSTAVVEVTAQAATNDWAKAGIMVRDDITKPDASPGYAILAVTPGHGYALQWDSNGDGQLDSNSAPPDSGLGTAVYPSWLKLVRSGPVVTGYYSTDDATWTLVGTATLPGITPTQDVGVFTTAHQAGTIGEADYKNFTLG